MHSGTRHGKSECRIRSPRVSLLNAIIENGRSVAQLMGFLVSWFPAFKVAAEHRELGVVQEKRISGSHLRPKRHSGQAR
jgi:hypothetical protein